MRTRILALLAALGSLRCGGSGSPSGPSRPTPAPPAGFPAGTVISIVSGETGAPVPGARLVAGGRTVAGDGTGRITLPERLDANSPVDVTAAGFLDRVTRLRSREPIALWPTQSPTGLDQHYSVTLVYTSASAGVTNPPLGGDPLYRLGAQTRQVFLAPDVELQRDPQALSALREAAERIGSAAGGQVAYSVTNTPPAGAVRFDVRLDPASSTCEGARAFTTRSLRGTEIVGGSITFCSVEASRAATATHEVGHSFGYRHGPDPRDVMFGGFSAARAVDFGPREMLVARLMLQRPAGNRWPDDDRELVLSAAPRTEVIVCRGI